MLRLRTALIGLMAMTCLAGCGASDPDAGSTTATVAAGPPADASRDERIEASTRDPLATLSPLSGEALLAHLPDRLPAFHRTTVSTGSTGLVALHQASAAYVGDETAKGQRLSVTITDGAGETGSALIAMMRTALARDFEQHDDGGYERSVTVREYRVIEQYSKGRRALRWQLLVGDRFMVELEGHNMDAERLLDSFDGLDLGRLVQA